jgi:hypothetical protein
MRRLNVKPNETAPSQFLQRLRVKRAVHPGLHFHFLRQTGQRQQPFARPAAGVQFACVEGVDAQCR